MSNTNSVCTSCVVLAQQHQEAVQHHEHEEAIATTKKTPQKQCTVVENGKVVVRPIETPQA